MPTSPSPELSATFRALADIVYAGESFEQVAATLCRSAVAVVDGCDHASLLVRREGRALTAAASDEVAEACDALERECGEGPCLDVLDEDEPQHHVCTDLHHGGTWPRLAERVLAETPVRGLAGFRLRDDATQVGALNIFSDTAGLLGEPSLHQATLLTAFASVSLAAAGRGQDAASLREGLDGNREIGKAVGLLMAMHDLDQDAATAMLTQISREMDLGLVEVAARVVRSHRPDG